jgi:peptidoglycan/xylan/chitin deacetylase (PgdA/CDA1 family)
MRMAASLGLDAEHRFERSREIADRLSAARVPFTSFVLTSLAAGQHDALAALAEASELGSHTHDHRVLSEQDEDAQRRQLEESRRIVAELTGETVLGLRPPQEETNEHTLQALAETGYHYVVGWREKDAAEPWMLQANGKAVVVLPRIPHDDFEYVVRRPGSDAATAWASMRADLKQVQRLGGYYFFDFHTQFWDAPAIAKGVRHLTGLRNLPGVWLATVGDVAAWWRTRARAAARVDADPDGGITVELASGAAVPELGVAVYVPSDPAGWSVEAVRGAAPTAVVVGGQDDVVRLVYRDLGANDRRITRLVRAG